MHSDNQLENDIHRNDCEFQYEQFFDRSQFYLDRLRVLKTQLNDIDRINQSDLYIGKLNEIDKIIRGLARNIRHIEQLHLQLTESDRLKLDDQIHRLHIEIDREMSEFHRVREQSLVSSLSENTSSIDAINTTNGTIAEDVTSNGLRQRHISTNRLNDSYDLLEQDLAYLREAINEVATIVARQEQLITKTAQFKTLAKYPVGHVSSLFQKTIHNRYVTVVSGALLGATIGGPVGFMMGSKIGTLVALTGSAIGALSMNIMQQRVSETDEFENNTTAYHQAML